MNFLEWQALNAWGATLTELYAWEMGKQWPVWFKAKVCAWYELHNQVEMHGRDAARPKGKR